MKIHGLSVIFLVCDCKHVWISSASKHSPFDYYWLRRSFVMSSRVPICYILVDMCIGRARLHVYIAPLASAPRNRHLDGLADYCGLGFVAVANAYTRAVIRFTT